MIAPSVLSMDFSKAKESLAEIEKTSAAWIHYDVMDGHFVDNLTFGASILKDLSKMTSLFLDVHLMIENPQKYSLDFIKAGANQITVHLECFNSIEELQQMVNWLHEQGVKVGVTAKPKTDMRVLEPILSQLDTVLVMSVEPGFGGQSFMMDSLEKIAYFDQLRKKYGYSYLIEVDGGINAETAQLVKQQGCDVLVAGSYVFNGDIVERINSL